MYTKVSLWGWLALSLFAGCGIGVVSSSGDNKEGSQMELAADAGQPHLGALADSQVDASPSVDSSLPVDADVKSDSQTVGATPSFRQQVATEIADQALDWVDQFNAVRQAYWNNPSMLTPLQSQLMGAATTLYYETYKDRSHFAGMSMTEIKQAYAGYILAGMTNTDGTKGEVGVVYIDGEYRIKDGAPSDCILFISAVVRRVLLKYGLFFSQSTFWTRLANLIKQAYEGAAPGESIGQTYQRYLKLVDGYYAENDLSGSWWETLRTYWYSHFCFLAYIGPNEPGMNASLRGDIAFWLYPSSSGGTNRHAVVHLNATGAQGSISSMGHQSGYAYAENDAWHLARSYYFRPNLAFMQQLSAAGIGPSNADLLPGKYIKRATADLIHAQCAAWVQSKAIVP